MLEFQTGVINKPEEISQHRWNLEWDTSVI